MMIGEIYILVTLLATEHQIDTVKKCALKYYSQAIETSSSLNATDPIKVEIDLKLARYKQLKNNKKDSNFGEPAVSDDLEK